MLKTTNNYLLFLLLFIFGFHNYYGQNTTEKIALSTIIKSTETKFNVRFTYATQNIKGIYINPPNEKNSLSETLIYLTNNTQFTFTQVDDRFITVVAKNKKDTLCGIIINAFTGELLEGANIMTIGNSYSTITNSEGKFFIPKSISASKIRISYIGYEEKEITIKELEEVDCAQILIQLSISELDQVYITNYFTKGIEKQYDGSTTLNTNNFGLLPGQIDNDVLQIIQVIPGIESVDEKVSNINIRGGTHDESLFLWDDIKIYQNGHFFGLISAFNPDLTKNVTIYKNGTPSRFGEGVSGVIDMKSNNSLTNDFNGGAGFNLINANAFVSIPISNNFGIQVSGRRSINNLFESSVYNSYSDRIFQDTEITNAQFSNNSLNITTDEDFTFYDFSTKILWDFSEKDKVRINFLTINNSIDFIETNEDTSQSKTSDLQQQSILGGISWDRIWSSKIMTTTLVYGSYYLLNSLNKDIFTTQEQLQENELLETGIKMDAKINISEKINVQSGYHFSETGIANTQDVNLPRFRLHEKNVLQSHIVFGNIEYKLNKNKTIINAGLRANYFSKFTVFLIEPRLSIHQKLGKGFAVEALGEFKNQTTTQRIDFQSDFLGVEKRRWILVNNDDIPIIKSKQVSLGFMYSKHNWFVNLEGFYKEVDGITTSNQGFQNQFQFVKTDGNYRAKGIELAINKKINSFSSWLSYTYMNNDYQFDDLIPSDFPNNIDIRHSATLASTYSYKKFKMSLGVNWHSGKPYTIPLKGEEIISDGLVEFIQYDSPNAERLSDYLRANISAEYRWKLTDKIETKFNLAVLNILNKENTLNIRYNLTTDENGESQVNQIKEISLGITPNFSLQVLF